MSSLTRRTALRVAYAFVLTLFIALPAAAQDDQSLPDTGALSPPASVSLARLERDWLPAAPIVGRVNSLAAPRRPTILPTLYASFAALQIADLVLTREGIAKGVAESNPLVERLGTGAGLIAFKAGTATASIYACEKLWKRNRAAAIAAMIAINSAYGTIVAHNYSLVRGLR